MTPEERIRDIENVLKSITQNLVLFHSEMQELKEVQLQHGKEIDKHREAIKDLITVSRALMDSQKEAQKEGDRAIRELRELHWDTEEKLNALIATAGRIIRDKK
jgi:geranylgeranyl pyrophosphate synthase